jgi:two-component system cell cycle sensor histidine kinase/response regulator CckA
MGVGGRPLRALIVEDYESDARLLTRELRRGGRQVEVHIVTTIAATRAALTVGGWDVILTDWKLPGFGALEVLAVARELGVETPAIVVSGSVTEDHALSAMRAGARDFVLKDHMSLIGPAVERELREVEQRIARRRADDERRMAAQIAEVNREAQLRQLDVMDALGRLSGAMAHDFNNILCVILSYSDTLLALLEPGELHSDVEQIHSAANRGAVLTRQLLTFNRLQLVEPRELDLNDLVGGMAGALKQQISSAITLVSRGEPALGQARADHGSIEQAIQNLVANACDAMPGGGTLTLETTNIVLEATADRELRPARDPHDPLDLPPGRYVQLAIADTGAGMDETTKSRMFEPFFTTKPRGRGTGLGLSTVFGIVQQAGGYLAVDSAPGAGTTVRIYLPRIDAAITARSAGGVPQTATRGRNGGTVPRP